MPSEEELLARITVNPAIFGGQPIIRGRRLAVEHILGLLAAGDDIAAIVGAYDWVEEDDVYACLVYARRIVGNERFVPRFVTPRSLS